MSEIQAAIPATTRVGAVSNGLQLGIAFALGVVILYGAGFVQVSEAHNAAHDMRHSHVFPCH